MDIAGSATLDGELDISLLSFAPSNNDSFTVLSAAGGITNSMTLAGDMANDFSLSLANSDTDLVLTFQSAAGIDGDYDDGGLVEQTDLDLVLLNWGAAVPPIPTNPILWVNQVPTDDEIVDQNDLDGVLLNWGNTLVGAVSSVAAVPEPVSASLLVMALGTLALVGRRQSIRMSRG